jgi:hypothetical protein
LNRFLGGSDGEAPMSFVGKILTVLIFFLSVTFMAFAVAIYAAHKNWYDIVHNATADPSNPNPNKRELGLLAQLDQAKQDNTRLDREKRDLENQLNTEKVMRRLLISRAEQTQTTIEKELANERAKVVTALNNAEATSNAALATAKSNESLAKEVADIRNVVKTTREEFDKTFASMVAQTDTNSQLRLLLDRLKQQQLVLAEQVGRLKNVIAKHGLDEHAPVDDLAPRAEAVVTAVRQDGRSVFVTVSLGKDDGIRPGHQMNVFRGERYVGRITIRSVEPNRSVGESDPTYYERPFQVSDIAHTITPDTPATARR